MVHAKAEEVAESVPSAHSSTNSSFTASDQQLFSSLYTLYSAHRRLRLRSHYSPTDKLAITALCLPTFLNV